MSDGLVVHRVDQSGDEPATERVRTTPGCSWSADRSSGTVDASRRTLPAYSEADWPPTAKHFGLIEIMGRCRSRSNLGLLGHAGRF